MYIQQNHIHNVHKLETTQMSVYRMDKLWDTAINEPQLHTTKMNIRNYKSRQRNKYKKSTLLFDSIYKWANGKTGKLTHVGNDY